MGRAALSGGTPTGLAARPGSEDPVPRADDGRRRDGATSPQGYRLLGGHPHVQRLSRSPQRDVPSCQAPRCAPTRASKRSRLGSSGLQASSTSARSTLMPRYPLKIQQSQESQMTGIGDCGHSGPEAERRSSVSSSRSASEIDQQQDEDRRCRGQARRHVARLCLDQRALTSRHRLGMPADERNPACHVGEHRRWKSCLRSPPSCPGGLQSAQAS